MLISSQIIRIITVVALVGTGLQVEGYTSSKSKAFRSKKPTSLFARRVLLTKSSGLRIRPMSRLTDAAKATHPAIVNRVKGSILAGAIGDAMGNPTEFIKPVAEIYKKWPHGIHSFKDFKKSGTVIYTDDTAMTKVTLEVLRAAQAQKWDRNQTMSRLAVAYVADMHKPKGWAWASRAPGNGCLAAIRALSTRLHDEQEPWQQDPTWWQEGTRQYAATQTGGGGCGAVMRAHPFGLVFYNNPKLAATWAAEHSKITHGAPTSLAASAAMAMGTACAIKGEKPEIIIKNMITTARQYDPATAAMMTQAVAHAKVAKMKVKKYSRLKDQVIKVHDPFFTKHEGWDAKTAIAAVTYIFAFCPQDVAQGIYLGVHTPGDSDSIASMAGALIGARVGGKKVAQLYKADIARLENAKQLSKLAEPN